MFDWCVSVSRPVFTAEQYQQHQEQLVLMQKQQLEQSQQQQPPPPAPPPQQRHTPALPPLKQQQLITNTQVSDTRGPASSQSQCEWTTDGPHAALQALVSKTLDQASAQFAASALITTDQLLAFKSKEEQVLPSGVNGVLSGSGGSEVRGLPLDALLHRGHGSVGLNGTLMGRSID